MTKLPMRLHIVCLIVLMIDCYIHGIEGWGRWRAPRVRVRLPRIHVPKIKVPKVKIKDVELAARVGTAAVKLTKGDPKDAILLGSEIIADKVAKKNPNSKAAKALKTAVTVAKVANTVRSGKKREVREVKPSSKSVDIPMLYGLTAIETVYGASNITRIKGDMENITLTCDMTHYDEDGNEKIDKEEFENIVKKDGFGNAVLLFTALDSNGDKKITKDEFDDMAPTLSERSIFPDCEM